MDLVEISNAIFEILSPHFMATISILLSGIYLFKYMCASDCTGCRKPIYLLRAFLWGLFTIAWVVFPSLGLFIGRSVLRAMVATVVAVEVAYNLFYIRDAFKEMRQWTYRRYRIRR
jgi:hypothetical protein